MSRQAQPDLVESVRSTGPALFLAWGLVAVLIPALVILSLGFLVAPTAERVLSGAGFWMKAGALAAGILLVAGYLTLGLTSVTGVRLLPLSLVRTRRLTCRLFPGARNVARVLGSHEAALGRSFLLVQNNLVRAWGKGKASENVLVLLPHCLEPSVRAKIEHVVDQYHCRARIVGGGSQALQVVEEEAPDALVAVACERDLVSGVTDLGGELPWVLAVPNIQRHGPCRRTDVRVDEFEAALDLLAVKRDSAGDHLIAPRGTQDC